MMNPAHHDSLSQDGDDYIYKDGTWVNKLGYLVATNVAQRLTLRFFEQHGRPPSSPKSVRRLRRSTKAELARAKVLRAAISKALASRSSR